MSKIRKLMVILFVILLVVTVTASAVSAKSASTSTSTAFSQKITASTLATPVSTANLAKNLDKWYYGKVNDVALVISDDTTLDLKYKSGKTFVTQTFTIKPASTSGWNNA